MQEPNYRTIVEQVRTHLGLNGITEVGTLCKHVEVKTEDYGKPDTVTRYVDITISFRINNP